MGHFIVVYVNIQMYNLGMNTIYLLTYNNYFNRILKPPTTVNYYLRDATNNHQINNFNFNPNDGVMTQIVVGTYNINPIYDYLIVTDNETAQTVISRWFIIECKRTRQGQYNLTLKRDVLADYYEPILYSPLYLIKGWVSDVASPLLYNKENIEFNQIKQWDEEIVDSTGCAYVVAYLPVGTTKDVEINISNNVKFNMHVETGEATALEDAPYSMLIFPIYSKNKNRNTKPYESTLSAVTMDESYDRIILRMAKELGRDMGTTVVWDVQLLPFCPVLEVTNGSTDSELNFKADVNGVKADPMYIYRHAPGDPEGGVCSGWGYVVNKRMGEMNITVNLYPKNIPGYPFDTVLKKKISNQVDMFRISAGNYSSSYEFNIARGGGTLTQFHVNFTYRPFNPYIQIYPVLEGLYGPMATINDARGCVLAGDYSLEQLNDAWTNYQMNNKNYEAIFNRQIENMDTNRNLNRTSEIINTVLGSGVGAVGGAVAGTMVAPGVGTIAGAAAGGALSAAGGISDIAINEAKYREQKTYAIDMYNYNLDNIKALPNTLSKSSAFNVNSHVFPILEYYSCTDTERTIFRNLLLYNGMTINAITTLDVSMVAGMNYWHCGEIIRVTGIADDSHVVDEIYSELKKGVFM